MAITKIQSESMNLADTYAFTGTVTGAGGVNTPFFQLTLILLKSLIGLEHVKITNFTEIFDSASAFSFI